MDGPAPVAPEVEDRDVPVVIRQAFAWESGEAVGILEDQDREQ